MVGDATGTLNRLDAAQICARLAAERTLECAAVAFDGDGTLWSGDVGEDVFRAAIAANAMRDDAGPALVRAAREHGVDTSGTPTRIAQSIFEAYLRDGFPERQLYEVMTWCYAGWTLEELHAFSRAALARAELDARLHVKLEPVISFARKSGIRTVVVSASPTPVVQEAAARWGFDARDIAAAPPAVADGVILDRMGGVLPYAEAKCVAGRALLGAAEWLAAFGDSAFDVEMFAAARFGVAVEPKPKLLEVLPNLPNAFLLA